MKLCLEHNIQLWFVHSSHDKDAQNPAILPFLAKDFPVVADKNVHEYMYNVLWKNFYFARYTIKRSYDAFLI